LIYIVVRPAQASYQ